MAPRHGLAKFAPSAQISRRALLAAGGGLAAYGLGRQLWSFAPEGPPLQSAISGAGYPYTITDPTGDVQILAAPPARIVSTSLASDENLALLVGPERVCSVTYLADDPAISNVVHSFPSTTHRNRADLEGIIALEPDLVILSNTVEADFARVLMGCGIKIVRLSFFDGFSAIDANMRLLARLLAVEAKADGLLTRMWGDLDAIARLVQPLRRPRVLWHSVGSYASGPGTTTDDMITRAGGYNSVRDVSRTGSFQLPEEVEISLQPDVLLMSAWSGEGEARDLMRAAPAWQDVPAIKTGRIYAISSAATSTGSPFLVRGVRLVAEALYPGLFNQDVR